ncbi:hypothetical protein GTR00_08250 [Kineococcus sp. T90]|nr:hypothetical protein [Kineococcus indalonis]
MPLHAAGADAVRAALDAGDGPPLVVLLQREHEVLHPAWRYRLDADTGTALAVLARHRRALAAHFGPAGGQAEQDALLEDLVASGAVDLTWHRVPPGWTPAQVARAEQAVLQRWAARAVGRLVTAVEPAAGPADDDGAGLSLTLADPADPARLDLSEQRGGSEVVREPFSCTTHLGLLTGLGPAGHAVDADDDAALPVVVNVAADPRVRRCTCHVGYRRADGTVGTEVVECPGEEGASRTVLVRWDPREARPERVEVRWSLQWARSSWPDSTGSLSLGTRAPCLAVDVGAATRVAEVGLVCDLAGAPAGALAVVGWRALVPAVDGGAAEHSGSFFVEPTGAAGELAHERFSFPHPEGREAECRVEWTAQVVLPDGSVLSGRGGFTLAERTVDLVALTALVPA